MKIDTRISPFLILAITLVLAAGCASSGPEAPATTSPASTATPTLGRGGAQSPATETDEGEVGIPELATLAQVAPTRTPEPTATPEALTEAAGHAGLLSQIPYQDLTLELLELPPRQEAGDDPHPEFSKSHLTFTRQSIRDMLDNCQCAARKPPCAGFVVTGRIHVTVS